MQLILEKHHALGTAWWVEAVIPKERESDIAQQIIAHLNRFEQRYSRFLPDSLVSTLNTTRELANPDPELVALLEYGQSLYDHSFGHFNFLVGNILVARGYGHLGSDGNDTKLANPRSDLTLSATNIILAAGSVDCGGFGKGYVIDEIATLLREAGVEYFLINGGGDIYGTSEPDDQPITIHLEHPTKDAAYLGTTTIFHQGFAASSPYKRTWKKDNQTHHHLVGSVHAASFIVAPLARTADAFATACLLATPEEIMTMNKAQNLGTAYFFPETNELTTYNFPFAPA